jgi:hypothetical protein
MRLLCLWLRCNLIWLADIPDCGLYQCKRCKTVTRGPYGWSREVRRATEE